MIKEKPLALFLSILLILFVSCSDSKPLTVELEKDKNAILSMHNAQRDYHFQKDSTAFAHQLSDHFISVNKGEISSPTRKATIARYNNYFSAVEFIKWDDVSDPIIKFSDDHSLAYTIVDKIVILNYKTEDGELITDSTHFAWTAIYKRYDDGWKIDCVTSTDKPSL